MIVINLFYMNVVCSEILCIYLVVIIVFLWKIKLLIIIMG